MKNNKVLVYGLDHLGCTTAACLAKLGFEVIGLDSNAKKIQNLKLKNKAPIKELGLNQLIKRGLKGNLDFIHYVPTSLLQSIDYVWITFDTPVDKNDIADTLYVIHKLDDLLEHVNKKTKIIISSQLPVGTIARIEKRYPQHIFCCAPENLRHGNAINVFMNPDRIVIGVRKKLDKRKFNPLFKRISDKLEWMSIESAEMVKHSINGFLATSIVFINTIKEICDEVGADPMEVSRGLKTDERIGQKSYLRPGEPYTGGTLGRDIQYLRRMYKDSNLFSAIKESNDKELKK